jgi:hypothetical protein
MLVAALRLWSHAPAAEAGSPRTLRPRSLKARFGTQPARATPAVGTELGSAGAGATPMVPVSLGTVGLSMAPPPPPPPPPPRAAGPAPAPSAPPLPFQYLGKLDDSERLRVFLLRGERIHTVSVGDVIDGTYRVERIDGGQMTLIYLPLNISQTLSVGSAL